MTFPYSFIEARQAQSEELREKSLAMHDLLMHLPKSESLLKRLMRRLREMTSSTMEARPRPSMAEKIDANRPPAFSK